MVPMIRDLPEAFHSAIKILMERVSLTYIV